MTTFLIILSIALAVLAVGQLMRVFEASSKLKGETSEVPTDAENRYQAKMMLVFLLGYFSFFIWLVARYGDLLLPEAASEHGVLLDNLLDFNFAIITIVFAITHVYLFYFAFKYVFDKDRKAYYFTHSNKLELLWTTVPALFLAVIVIWGLSEWIDITMDETPKDAVVIELYPKQFDWTARYAGADSTLGASNYNMISGTNPLGVITDQTLSDKIAELEGEIAEMQTELDAAPAGGLKEEELTERIEKWNRTLDKVKSFEGLEAANREYGNDDILVKSEFVIPLGREVAFKFRSRDVIHSAYMPHFRAQMNCVPGMVTEFHFKPTITTEQMREKTNNEAFDYILLCNKICGAAHYNMQMNIRVVSEEEFNKWMAEQKTFKEDVAPDETAEVSSEVGMEISMIEQ
ncbi:MAG: cytochrome c oxidase subunit II [Flavobacteriales bacterium]|jgi:cytochrome c oxidase subunit II|nr:cytochrome c oxidase subunit II [Flavobacteriales bacterium]